MNRFHSLLTSADPGERQLAADLCLELVGEPEEELLDGLWQLLPSASADARVTLLELLTEYAAFDCTRDRPALAGLLRDGAADTRLAAFRYLEATGACPSATTLLDALADPVGEICRIAVALLGKTILDEANAFAVVDYLRHDHPAIRGAARELLLACGQGDLLGKMPG